MDAHDADASLGEKVMILVGSQRAGATALADHLTNQRDNDHVQLLELRDFMAEDLHGALDEAHAISKATQCKQFMFSLSLNPPGSHIADEDEFRDAADRVEAKLGLTGQPRAIVIHEKEGRRHAHVVWSRINVDEMKAINLPHFKSKLRDLSRELFLDHGWELPKGVETHGGKSPLNFTLAEWQQAKRQNIDPREIKQVFRQAWERSDNLKSLSHALEERGYFLAQGDRRGYVAVDVHGNIYSLSKWSGVRVKDAKNKLGSPDQLRPVSEVQKTLQDRMKEQAIGYVSQVGARQRDEMRPLLDERAKMVTDQRQERRVLELRQRERWIAETKVRSDRLNTGLRGVWDRFTGRSKAIRDRNEKEAWNCAKRDQTQRNRLVVQQMSDRQGLQKRITTMRAKHKEDRKILIRDLVQYVRRQDRGPEQERQQRVRERSRGIGRSL